MFDSTRSSTFQQYWFDSPSPAFWPYIRITYKDSGGFCLFEYLYLKWFQVLKSNTGNQGLFLHKA